MNTKTAKLIRSYLEKISPTFTPQQLKSAARNIRREYARLGLKERIDAKKTFKEELAKTT
jgi:hypothetical protein